MAERRGRKRKLEIELNNLESNRTQCRDFPRTEAEPLKLKIAKDSRNSIGGGPGGTTTQDSKDYLKQLLVGQALNLVPRTFKSQRITYIRNILTQFDAVYKDMSENDICALVCEVEGHDEFLKYIGTPCTELLWKATLTTSIPHMKFLAPPTDTCYNCRNPLQSHNSPSVILCFTIQGPLPALKITLRCTQCHVNYRYNLWYRTDHIHAIRPGKLDCFIMLV